MAFHRVAVNVDGDRNCAKRVAFAAGIARRYGAELVGVYARLPNPASAAAVWPALPNDETMGRLREIHKAEVAAQIGALRPRFEEAAGAAPADWLETEGDRAAAMIRAAQVAGLLVVAQPDEQDPLNYLTRESVSDSERKAAPGDTERLLGFAGRMGANATFAEHVAREIRVSDVVMSRAADRSADLVVMGGYSHSRFREVVLGGATRDILDRMPVPVLMSH